MSLTSILSAEAIENAVKDCQGIANNNQMQDKCFWSFSHVRFSTAPDSFCYKKFFQLCGLSQKSPQEVKEVFRILDEDNSGNIEEAELK